MDQEQTQTIENEKQKARIKGIIEGLDMALDRIEIRDNETWNRILDKQKEYQKLLKERYEK